MSESKNRSVKEIQSEYSELCVKAGHLQYSIHALSLDLKSLNEVLVSLNLEGAAAQKREADEAASKAAS